MGLWKRLLGIPDSPAPPPEPEPWTLHKLAPLGEPIRHIVGDAPIYAGPCPGLGQALIDKAWEAAGEHPEPIRRLYRKELIRAYEREEIPLRRD